MTVEAAKEMWSKDKLDYTTPDLRRRKVKITKGYSVVAGAADSIESVLDAEDLPQLGDAYKTSPQIRVLKVTPLKVTPIYYIVMVEYVGEVAPGGTIFDDPVDTNPTIRWRNLITEEEIDEAYNDDGDLVPIATVNGEPVRGITERVVDWVAIIERNYALDAFDLPTLHNYLRSVNSDIVQTNLGNFAPGVARLTKFEPEEVFASENAGYIKVNAEVTFRYPYNTTADKAWYKRYLHQGYVMRVRPADGNANGEDDRFVNALDSNQDTSLKPLLLDEEGFPIADPEDPTTPAFYREQRTLINLPYSALGLF